MPKGKSKKTQMNSATANSVSKTVRAPVAANSSSRQSGKNTMRLRECERVGSVSGSSAFANVLSLAAQPGLASSFPWLSGHAALFESYRIHKLVYRYKNLKGTASDGNVIMSFDYDTLDSGPATAIEATQSTVYKDGAPWRIFEMRVPTDNRKLFTRTGLPAGADLKTYDMGKLHVSTEGCADTSVHGYIEVDYDVEFFDKQSSSSGTSSGTLGSSACYNLSSDFAVTNGETQIIPFDEEITNSLSVLNTAGSLALPAGTYLVTCDVGSDNGTAGSSSTMGLFVDGAAQAPPVNFPLWTASGPSGTPQIGCSATAILVLATAASVTVSITALGESDWVVNGDQTRITFVLLG